MALLPNEKLITTKEAGELSGYTSDYLSRLVRSGKIAGKKVGHSWLVDKESLNRFLGEQDDHKSDRARELARARAREYRVHRSVVLRAAKALTEPRSMPQQFVRMMSALPSRAALRRLRSHALALSVALLVLTFGTLGAQAEMLPRFAQNAAAVAEQTALGLEATFGDIPSHIAQRFTDVEREMRTHFSRTATTGTAASARIAPRVLRNLSVSLSFGQPETTSSDRAAFSIRAASASKAAVPAVTAGDIRAFAADAYAVFTSPSRVTDAAANAYVSVGEEAYGAIHAALAAYRSTLDEFGVRTLSAAAVARDTLRAAPAFVARTNLALGESVIAAARFVLDAEIAASYGLAAAAPASARATVALVGGTGDLLAGFTVRAAVEAPSRLARAILGASEAGAKIPEAVFSAEYAAATGFIAATNAVSGRYALALARLGEVGYESARGSRALVQSIPEEIRHPRQLQPSDLEHAGAAFASAVSDAYRVALDKTSLALDTFARTPKVAAVLNSPPMRALERAGEAGLAAALPALSAGEKAALATYNTIQSIFTFTTDSLANLFMPPPTIVYPSVAPARPKVVTAPAPRTSNSYTTIVRGVSEDFVNQSINSLRSSLLATIADSVRPVYMQTVTNAATTQQVNMIQDLHDLIVRNGDFRNSIFDNGIRVSATDGRFTNLYGGSASLSSLTVSGATSLATTTITGDLSVSGTITPSVISASDYIRAPYFVATSTTATSTFAGSLAIDTNGFVYATSTKNVGIGVLSPAALLAVQNSTSTQPIFVASSAAGSEVYRITNAGFVGIGTTTPGYNLAVEGSSSLGNQAIAGYFTATSTTATSTFAGRLAVGTSTPWGDGLFTVGVTTPLLYISSNTGRIGVGTSSPSTIFHISGTDGLIIPNGTTAQRPTTLVTGTVRYNSETQQFEGYGTSSWGSLGGVIDVDQDTKITAEDSAGADNDQLKFFTLGSERMRIDSNGLIGIGTTTPFANLSIAGSAGGTTNLFAISTSTAAFATTTALTIDSNGNLSLLNGANLTVGGNTIHTGTLTQTGLATFTNGFLSNASSTITSGLFTMSGGASTTNFTASGTASTTNLIASASVTFQNLVGMLSSNGTSGTSARTLTGTANQITIANGDGTGGNPTFSLPSLLAFTNASTSQLSVFQKAYFGGTSTTTIDSAGSITLPTVALLTAPYASTTMLTATTASTTDLIASASVTFQNLVGMLSSNGTSGTSARTLTGTANQITIANGDGTGGNPTFSLPSLLFITNASSTALSSLDYVSVGRTATTTFVGDYGASSLRGALTVYGDTTTGAASSLTLQRGSTNGDNSLIFNDQTGSPLLKLYTSANTGYSYLNGQQSYLSLGMSVGGEVLRIDTSNNARFTGNVIPSANQQYDLGTAAVYWNNAYINNVVANNLSSASTSIAGTNTISFSINSNNPTSDAQDMSLIFYRGAGAPSNAVLSWNSTLKRFEFNQNAYIANADTSPASTTLRIAAVAGQTGALTSWLDSSGNVLSAVTASGNIGVGTSTPYSKLAAWGTGSLFEAVTNASTTVFSIGQGGATSTSLFAGRLTANTFSAGQTASTTVDTAGNLSVGGTLTVAGLCVTGDTRLRRRRKARKGEEDEADEDGYIYDEVAIMDIKAGDEVQSLDEKTGKLVWSKVKQLAYMGKKQTYRITTEGGRQIRTTANHPYLTRKTKNPDLSAGAASVRSMVPKAITKSTGQAYAFIDASNLYYGAKENKYRIDFRKFAHYLRVRYGVSRILYYTGLNVQSVEQLNFYVQLERYGYEMRYVMYKAFGNGGDKADVDARMATDLLTYADAYDRAIAITGDGDFFWTLQHLMTSGKEVKLFGYATRTARELKRLLGAKFSDFARLHEAIDRVEETNAADAVKGSAAGSTSALYSLVYELSIMSRRSPVDKSNVRAKEKEVDKLVKEILYGSYKKPTPAHEERVWEKGSSSIADLLGLSSAPQAAVDNFGAARGEPVESGEGSWRKVAELKEGMEIAIAPLRTPDSGLRSPEWDRIVSVEPVAEEDVYDIEVEGTHNFIGNDIVAHNTAIFNNASTTQLSVTNKAYFGGTATSTFDSAGALTLITPLLVGSGGTGQTSFTADALHYGSFSTVATSSLAVGTGLTNSGTLGAQVGGSAASISFAAIAANSLWANNTGASAVPTNIATSSLFTWTGTGDVVRTTSPTLVTPALGTPSALVLTNATGLPVAGGGTGLSSVADGQLLFGSGGTAALTALATTSLAGRFLSLDYTTGRPSWVATSSINVAISDTTGTLAVARGGTGQTTFTSSQLLYGNGTAALSSVATSSIAVGTGISVTSGTLGSQVGGSDVTIGIANNALTLAQLPQVSAGYILGNNTGATANVTSFATSTLFGTGVGGQILAWNAGVPQFIATTSIPVGGNISGTLSNLTVVTNANLTGPITSVGNATAVNSQTGTGSTFVMNTSPTIATPTFTGLSTLASASSTLFSANSAYFGATATSTFTSAGRLGVLNSSPSYPIDVTGDINISLGSNYKINGANLSPGSWVASGNDVYNSNSGNIGIGTTTPYSRLSVWGGGTGATAMFELTNSASTTLASVLNDGTFYMKGNVGIGTTNPGALLTLDKASGTNRIYFDSAGVNKAMIGVSLDGATIFTQTAAGDMGIRSEANLMLGSGSGADVTINTNGNVGIGTTNPTDILTLDKVGGTNRITFQSAGAGTGMMGVSNAGATIFTQTAANDMGIRSEAKLMLGSGSGADMTIDTAGNIGIGTTTPYSRLSVWGGGTGATAMFELTNSASTTLASVLNDGTFYMKGNVGIGTTTPSEKLSLSSASGVNTRLFINADGGASAAVQLAGNGGNLYSMYNYAGTGDLRFATGAFVDKVTFTSAGNVGIGTTTPYSRLSVWGGGTGATAMFELTNSASTTLASVLNDGTFYMKGNVGIGTTTPLSKLAVSGGFSVGADYNIAAPTNGAIIQGNVGIGTTGPTSPLHVVYSKNDGWLAQLDNTGTGADANGLLIKAGVDTSDYILRLQSQAGADYMSVKYGGNVGIGTTGPGAKLEVNNRNTATGLALLATGGEDDLDPVAGQYTGIGLGYGGAANYIKGGILWEFTATNADGKLHFAVNNSVGADTVDLADSKMTILNNGNVGIGTTSPATLLEVGGSTANVTFDGYKSCTGFTSDGNGKLACTASDQRLKNNIQAMSASSSLAALRSLAPVSFYWRDASPSGLEQYGFIAQDVVNVFPNLVQTTNPTELTPGGTMTVNYIGLIAPMIGAIQALDAKLGPLAGVLSVVPGVESQCVTGDTKLRRRKKRSDGEYDYDEVAIADVVAGDEIQSLHEASGRVVYSRVNALIDMGEQEVFELVTKSGRRIRTTSNHPFLARMKAETV